MFVVFAAFSLHEIQGSQKRNPWGAKRNPGGSETKSMAPKKGGNPKRKAVPPVNRLKFAKAATLVTTNDDSCKGAQQLPAGTEPMVLPDDDTPRSETPGSDAKKDN